MKIYTKTGDSGDTGLYAGPRVSKDHARIEAFGEVDELNAALGVVLSHPMETRYSEMLSQVQHELFSIGAELATPPGANASIPVVGESFVTRIETWIDSISNEVPPLREFILPGGTPAASATHLARAICRRAERRLVSLHATDAEASHPICLMYLNRLGDLLFVLARVLNHAAGSGDVPWEKPVS